ncbi:MAG: 1-deoxy-D-xylulose-5-phosphate reductoisomerase [Candidatus Fonsibacter sp.]|nr:1-deoxy-D-xylulose-5-phosphate reductoisomerase [Candidatus Fonsibacter sp.]
MKKKICILGSTGSIGQTTLQIISKNQKDFDVVLLSGNNNIKLLISQAKKFKPKYIYSNNFHFREKIKFFCKNNKIHFIDDLKLLKKAKFDITVAAISGIAGLIPTIDIIKFSKKILIANKESIICGWKFILKELKKKHCHFIPIDSEHFSIFNLIENKNINSIKNIYLTASGGPFFGKRINLKRVTPSQAVKHPNWKMGKKISVDSANLMNKVLEVIEASLIFNLPINKLKIIVHPQSLIHAIVEFKNGLSSMLYHYNDMKIPIINSLYDNFCNYKNVDKKLLSQNKLTFEEVNIKKNPSLKILKLKNVLNQNGFILISALNEILVQKFLDRKIIFTDIINKLLTILKSNLVKNYLKNHQIRHINDVFKVYNFSRSILN